MDQARNQPLYFYNREEDVVTIYVDSDMEAYIRYVRSLPPAATFDGYLKTRTAFFQEYLEELLICLRRWDRSSVRASRNPHFDRHSYLNTLYWAVRASNIPEYPPLPSGFEPDMRMTMEVIDLTTMPDERAAMDARRNPIPADNPEEGASASYADQLRRSAPAPRRMPVPYLHSTRDREADMTAETSPTNTERPERPKRPTLLPMSVESQEEQVPSSVMPTPAPPPRPVPVLMIEGNVRTGDEPQHESMKLSPKDEHPESGPNPNAMDDDQRELRTPEGTPRMPLVADPVHCPPVEDKESDANPSARGSPDVDETLDASRDAHSDQASLAQQMDEETPDDDPNEPTRTPQTPEEPRLTVRRMEDLSSDSDDDEACRQDAKRRRTEPDAEEDA